MVSISLAGCCFKAPAPPLPASLTLPEELRACGSPSKAPASLPPVVGPVGLRGGYNAEHDARVHDQAVAIACGRTLAEVVLLVDAFNVVHGAH